LKKLNNTRTKTTRTKQPRKIRFDDGGEVDVTLPSRESCRLISVAQAKTILGEGLLCQTYFASNEFVSPSICVWASEYAFRMTLPVAMGMFFEDALGGYANSVQLMMPD